MSKLVKVDYSGIKIQTLKLDGIVWVALRDVCNGIGLSWQPQRLKVVEHPILSKHISEIEAESPASGDLRKMIMLDLEYFNGWLFSINPLNVDSSVRETLMSYQDECYKVLNDYWNKGYAINPRKAVDIIKISEQSSALRREIKFQSNPALRQRLYDEMAALDRSVGWEPPALQDLLSSHEISDQVAFLFDAYHLLNNDHELNHSKHPQVIAIEPVSFIELCNKKLGEAPQVSVLFRELEYSVSHPYIFTNKIRSALTGKAATCWLFVAKRSETEIALEKAKELKKEGDSLNLRLIK